MDRHNSGVRPVSDPGSVANAFNWDGHNWSRALSIWERYGASQPDAARVLELGTAGDGGLAHAFALSSPSFWLSSSYARAKESNRTEGWTTSESKFAEARLDGRRLPLRDSSVDLCLTKSVLGGLARQHEPSGVVELANEVDRVLTADGEYWFIENAHASALHQIVRRRFGAGSNGWHYLTESEVLEWLRPLEVIHIERIGIAAFVGRPKRINDILGEVDEALLERVLPVRWRYALVGVARKGRSDRSG